jgi:formamidopyrimidine-DNA glycosylase
LERRVVDVIVRERRLRWPIPPHFEAAIRHQTVRGIDRRAKYILIRLDAGTLILHLGMSGSLRLVKQDTPPKSHDHWDIRVDSGWILRFHDPRRFGSLHWTETDPNLHPLLAKLAPEPLSDAFDGEYLYRVTRKRSVAIKQFIMNSQVVVGVGNIYASEALFRARIAPRRATRRLTRKEAVALAQAIKDVLGEAIKIGGTTLRDYVNADGAPGYFRQKLFVYER